MNDEEQKRYYEQLEAERQRRYYEQLEADRQRLIYEAACRKQQQDAAEIARITHQAAIQAALDSARR